MSRFHLVKNPNPIGQFSAEASGMKVPPERVMTAEASGPVGLGPCASEKQCEWEPWCRIRARCTRKWP